MSEQRRILHCNRFLRAYRERSSLSGDYRVRPSWDISTSLVGSRDLELPNEESGQVILAHAYSFVIEEHWTRWSFS